MKDYTFNDLPEMVGKLLIEVSQLKELIQHTRHNSEKEDRVLSADQAAEYLGCSKLTVMKAKKSGAIPYHQFGKVLYFKERELDEATLVPMDLHINK